LGGVFLDELDAFGLELVEGGQVARELDGHRGPSHGRPARRVAAQVEIP
jgi:hypothetical protein